MKSPLFILTCMQFISAFHFLPIPFAVASAGIILLGD
jgi:hypothetical protein